MKTLTTLAASALISAVTIDLSTAMKTYLEELPNGSKFDVGLGHKDGDTSTPSEFGTAFAAVSHTWTPEFCEAVFPGSTVKNGEAFGDPCCTWKKGGTPDFSVEPFTDTAGPATTCAAGGGSGQGGSAQGGSAQGGDDAATKGGGDDAATKGGDDAATKGGDDAATTGGAPGGDPTQMMPTPETPPATGGTPPATGGMPPATGGMPPPPPVGGGCAAKSARKLRN